MLGRFSESDTPGWEVMTCIDCEGILRVNKEIIFKATYSSNYWIN